MLGATIRNSVSQVTWLPRSVYWPNACFLQEVGDNVVFIILAHNGFLYAHICWTFPSYSVRMTVIL